MPVNFAIYRILGNSLPPRHDPECTLRNLRYILAHEADLPGCSKHWILNGLIDQALATECRTLIEAAGQECHVLPFDEAVYNAQFLDASGLPADLAGNYPPDFNPVLIRNRLAIEWIYRHKSLTAININRARNMALDLGQSHARWTIPLDGGCYFTVDDWVSLTRTLDADTDALYALIPMLRLESNDRFMEVPGAYPIEPQIAFRDDAPDRFDERLRYGNRNKAEFLVRIAAPGPWHTWNAADWDDFTPVAAKAPGCFTVAGRAYRLETGAAPQVESHERQRHAARFEGVVAMTNALDRRALMSRMCRDCVMPLLAPEQTVDLRAQCEQLLDRWQHAYAENGWKALRKLWILPMIYGCGSADPRLVAGAGPLLKFMESGEEGIRTSLGMDADGTWMHLLKLALALYTAQWSLASRLLNYAPLRFIAQQTRNASIPPAALTERIDRANAWVLLARLSHFAGVDVAAFRGVSGESIPALLEDLARKGPEAPQWQADFQAYGQWLQMMQALLDGRVCASDAADCGDLMPEGWRILAASAYRPGSAET